MLIWETVALGGGERKKERKTNLVPWAPHIWGARGAPDGASAYAAFGGDKKEKYIGASCAPLSGGACGAPNDFKNVTRSMRIPNICLVLKLDNGKVVSIANGQTHSHTATQYGISI